MRSRRERLILFAAFALAIGVAMAHEYQIPQYCLRLIQHATGR
jgi:putative copper export protein